METKFNFKSQICTDKNQSERLLAFGLKKETADMGIIEGIEIDVIEVDWQEHSMHNSTPNFVSLPAWSLHRLVSMIEEDFQSNGRFFCLPMFGFDKSDNLYDNIIDAIEWLIKEGYFNKEYLEE